MRPFPFSHRPDSLFLMLPKSASGISVRAFESPWGTTDEMLCYADGVLFGRLVTNWEETNGRFVVALLPVLDSRRQYDWPSGDAFFQVISALVLDIPGAYLHCERDTDQEPVPIVRDAATLHECVKNLMAYCIEDAIPCPTFAYGYPRLAMRYADPPYDSCE